MFYSLLRTKKTHSVCTLAMPYLPLSLHFQPDSYVFTEDYQFSYSIPSAGSMWGVRDIYLRCYTDEVGFVLTSFVGG